MIELWNTSHLGCIIIMLTAYTLGMLIGYVINCFCRGTKVVEPVNEPQILFSKKIKPLNAKTKTVQAKSKRRK